MSQFVLFDPPTRRTRPSTPKAAARALDRSEQRERQAGLVLELVQLHSGLTVRELAFCSRGKLDHYQVMRRLNDLSRSGLVRCGPSRACTVTGTSQMTWEEVEQ